MDNFRNFTVITIFVICLGVFGHAAEKQECPAANLIYPCTCSIAFVGHGRLRCEHSQEVTQDVINGLFEVYRELNNLTGPNEWLDLESFALGDSLMTNLDLTPFLYTRFTYFTLNYNSHLASISGPDLNSSAGLISIEHAYLHYNAFTTPGFGNALRYFAPEPLLWLDLTRNQLTGNENGNVNSTGTEFLPGLSKFVNLDVVDFALNKIREVGPYSFRTLTKLRILDLSLNEKVVVGDMALFFDDPPAPEPGAEPRKLQVDLRMNNYTTGEVSPKKSGLWLVKGRNIDLDITWNEIETLPEEDFRDFLEANYETQRNTINTWNNWWVCDERIKWLVDRKGELYSRVQPWYFDCRK